MAFFDNMDEKISNLINTGAGKAKDMSDSLKISSAIKDEQRKQEDLYKQIGQYYYDNFYDEAEGQLRVLCTGVKASKVQILQYQDQLNKLKGAVTCPGCGAQVPANAGFCSVCGMKMVPQNTVLSSQIGRKCPSCGSMVDKEAMFCTSCGKRMPKEQVDEPDVSKEMCPVCGAAVETDQAFCTNCGSVIERKAEQVSWEEVEESKEQEPESREVDNVFSMGEVEKVPEVRPDVQVTPREESRQGICPECGKKLKPGQRFCTNCGTRIEE